MYRTIYETATGKILISRKMSDELLAKRLANNTDQSSLDVYTEDVNNYKVDLSNLTVVANPIVEDLNYWMKQRRTAELYSCDWTQTVDAPLTDSKKAEWATYRQALRDLPATYPNVTNKSDITWPSKPE